MSQSTKQYIVARRLPSGARGKFRYQYWNGTQFVIDDKSSAFVSTKPGARIVLAMASNAVSGQRHKPYLMEV